MPDDDNVLFTEQYKKLILKSLKLREKLADISEKYMEKLESFKDEESDNWQRERAKAEIALKLADKAYAPLPTHSINENFNHSKALKPLRPEIYFTQEELEKQKLILIEMEKEEIEFKAKVKEVV